MRLVSGRLPFICREHWPLKIHQHTHTHFVHGAVGSSSRTFSLLPVVAHTAANSKFFRLIWTAVDGGQMDAFLKKRNDVGGRAVLGYEKWICKYSRRTKVIVWSTDQKYIFKQLSAVLVPARERLKAASTFLPLPKKPTTTTTVVLCTYLLLCTYVLSHPFHFECRGSSSQTWERPLY